MKTLILIILLFSINVWAVQNYFPVGKPGSITTYTKLSKCKSIENPALIALHTCFEITGKDLRKWKVDLIDNPESPKYNKRGMLPCTDLASCQPLYDALDCSIYDPGSFKVMIMGYTEVYCAEPNGFNQMGSMVSNPDGIIAADKEDNDAITDRANRKTKQNVRNTSLETCAKMTSMTKLESDACIIAIAKELRKGNLLESEL